MKNGKVFLLGPLRGKRDFVIGGDGLQEALGSYCTRMGFDMLLEQWDARRNLPLTPAHISYISKQKVWRRCDKGHTWQASV
ncbi:zinc-ribbon domain-containing protein, partial [uncultured Flavonifractor sp.]